MLRTLVEGTIVGVYVIQNGAFRFCNEAMGRMFGYPPEAIVGEGSVAGLIHPDDRQKVVMKLRERVEGVEIARPYQFRGVRRDGTLFVAEVLGVRTEFGGAPAVIGTIQDVSERVRSREWFELLARASALLSGSLELSVTLQTLVRLIVDNGLADYSTVEMLNERGELVREAGAHAEREREPELAALRRYVPNGSDHHPINKVLRTGEPLLLPILTPEDLERIATTEGHLAAMRSLGLRSAILVPLRHRDVTYGVLTLSSARLDRLYGGDDLRLAEEIALRASLAIDNARVYEEAKREVRLREEFLSIASHELKTPLTSLKLQGQLLLKAAEGALPGGFSRDRLAEVATDTNERIDYFSRMVDTLLDLTRIQSGRLTITPRPCDLVRIARLALEALEAERTLSGSGIRLESPAELLGAWDPLRIQQVLSNLLSNAIKYGMGQPIRLALRNEEASAVIEVADHGHGIASDCVTKIFEPFERAGAQAGTRGLGLGLFIVRNIVHAHGGDIRVRSALGKGTEFSVRIPREVS